MDGEQEIMDQKKIMLKLQTFYTNLYDKDDKCSTGTWIKNLKQLHLVPQISEDEYIDLDAPLTLEELKYILEKCAKNI